MAASTTNPDYVTVTITPYQINICPNGVTSAEAIVTPASSASSITFKISDATIATVSPSVALGGTTTLKITGLKTGSTTLMAMKGSEVKCSVNVLVGTWETDKGIHLEGEVSQSSPTGPSSKNLHYGPTSPTKAIFDLKLDMGYTKDVDKCSCTGEEKDAGVSLEEEDIVWTVVPAAAGSIIKSNKGMRSEFTPSEQVFEGIKIMVYIKEGKKYSYWNQNYDYPAALEISGLNTFKVGVKLVGGGVDQIQWEDSTATSLTKLVKSENFTVGIDTGVFEERGVVSKPNKCPGAANKNFEWVTIARSQNSDLTAIPGNIKFKPQITIKGKYRVYFTVTGALPPGTGLVSAAVKLLSAVVNPYVAAITEIAATASSTTWSMTWQASLAGQAVIEEVSSTSFNYSYTRETESVFQDLSVLSINPSTALSKAAGSTIHGSADIASLLQVDDDSITSGIVGVMTNQSGIFSPEPNGDITSVEIGVNKPIFSPAN